MPDERRQAIRLIHGTRTDAADPGVPATALVYAPECNPTPRDEPSCRIHCPFLRQALKRDKDFFIYGVDDQHCIELAVKFSCTMLAHFGVRDLRMAVVLPGQEPFPGPP